MANTKLTGPQAKALEVLRARGKIQVIEKRKAPPAGVRAETLRCLVRKGYARCDRSKFTESRVGYGSASFRYLNVETFTPVTPVTSP